MSVELLIGNELGTKAYLPAVKEGIEWTTERKNTPGKLSFEVLKDDALNFSEGSAVRMKENGDEVFFGFVFKQQRAKEQISQTSFFLSERELRKQLKDTTDARAMIEQAGTPPLQDVTMIQEILLAAAKGE